MNTNDNQIVFYSANDGVTEVQVNIEQDTVWLSLNQISTLFNKDKSVISRHIRNVFKEEELDKSATVAKNATVQKEGKREVLRNIDFYNLDVIISVGYRVNSKEGTRFRIWATKRIKEHLIKGYTVNQERLQQLQKTVKLLSNVSKQLIKKQESQALFLLLEEYSQALDILDDYDHRRIVNNTNSTQVTFKIEYKKAKSAIESLRVKFGGSALFGKEKDDSFKSSIAVIDQTFDGKELYTSIEEKAANLLYLVVKNHSFVDGNKRIAAWLFIWYLDQNNFLFKENGLKNISNSTLVALTLMIAESNPSEKEIIIYVIMKLMNISS